MPAILPPLIRPVNLNTCSASRGCRFILRSLHGVESIFIWISTGCCSCYVRPAWNCETPYANNNKASHCADSRLCHSAECRRASFFFTESFPINFGKPKRFADMDLDFDFDFHLHDDLNNYDLLNIDFDTAAEKVP